ncbi:MAG: hypothetical protein II467_07030 [Bacilli bacterium]|nr:hypothetical protein [Bacilli bacterium]MBQ4255907.1 hypothetical protein [Bacilli bacterium]
MILLKDDLQKRYQDYSNIKTKVAREVKNGNLIMLKKGIYTDDFDSPAYVFANAISSPSYLSFESALYLHGLISKKPNAVFSSTRGKNKTKKFVNKLGTFYYRDVPTGAYSKGNIYFQEGSYSFLIANKEKAICECLYAAETMTSIKAIKDYLFNQLKISEEVFFHLNLKQMLSFCPLYKSRSVSSLERLLQKTLGIVPEKKLKAQQKAKETTKEAWDALARLRNKYN